MQPQYPPKKPCKFGMDCHKFQQGICTYLHDQGSYQGQGGRGGRGYMDNRQGGSMGYNPQGGRGQQSFNSHGNTRDRNFRPPRENNHNQYPQQNQQNPNQNPRQQHNQQNQHNQSMQPIQEYCRFYQTGTCNKEGACKRIHGFTKNQSITRTYFNRDVVTQQGTHIGVFTIQGKNYISFRNGYNLMFLEYDFDTKDIKMVDQCQLKEEKYHYIATKKTYVYFAYDNSNGLFSIGYYDILNKSFAFVQNAHQKPVTDLVHHNINGANYLLSGSIDGTIKAWKFNETNQLVLDSTITDNFKNFFNNGNQNLQILFLDLKEIAGTTALVAGTNDNRILFWIGSEMGYQQVVFPEGYSKVLAAKFVQYEQSWVGIVLVWSTDHSKSALLGLDIGTFNPSLLTQGPELITAIQPLGSSMLLVSDMQGTVTIYNIPNFQQKVGFIMHNNVLASMASSQITLQTGINITFLCIAQKMTNSKKGHSPGSFGIYILK